MLGFFHRFGFYVTEWRYDEIDVDLSTKIYCLPGLLLQMLCVTLSFPLYASFPLFFSTSVFFLLFLVMKMRIHDVHRIRTTKSEKKKLDKIVESVKDEVIKSMIHVVLCISIFTDPFELLILLSTKLLLEIQLIAPSFKASIVISNDSSYYSVGISYNSSIRFSVQSLCSLKSG